MQKENPLTKHLYDDPCYREVARTIGYAGCVYRELWEKLAELVRQYGQQRVESATANLFRYEGQFRTNPPPLAQVQLRSDIRPLCWGLLGPPPEHPWHELFKRPEPLPPPWEMEPDGSPRKKPQAEEPPATKPKLTRKKKVS